MKKIRKFYVLTFNDCFSKYPTAEIFENANASNVIKFLDNCLKLHVVPRSLQIDQANCLIGNQI